ncbi:unnamed protein product [Mytilus coruscus]|uniref:Uncharacterized protein n=1 Tax=Mytilus coruscus TaxID=42192 RepID=A0A6J8AHG0_MYTCO|nr:unnamed protein product [Mytilus coruscus]
MKSELRAVQYKLCIQRNRINEVVIETLTNRSNYYAEKEIYKYYTNLTPFGLVPSVSENVTSVEIYPHCLGGCIFLNNAVNLEGNTSYEICFLHFNNLITITRISGEDRAVLKATFYRKILHSCEDYTKVWVSWNDGVIAFGTGNVGMNEKITTTDSKHFLVYGVGVTSFTEAVWKVNIKVSTQQIRTFCALECQMSKDCIGFNYRYGGSMNCELIEGGELIETEDDYEWHYYSKCLQDKSACLACR